MVASGASPGGIPDQVELPSFLPHEQWVLGLDLRLS